MTLKSASFFSQVNPADTLSQLGIVSCLLKSLCKGNLLRLIEVTTSDSPTTLTVPLNPPPRVWVILLGTGTSPIEPVYSVLGFWGTINFWCWNSQRSCKRTPSKNIESAMHAILSTANDLQKKKKRLKHLNFAEISQAAWDAHPGHPRERGPSARPHPLLQPGLLRVQLHCYTTRVGTLTLGKWCFL